MAALAFSISSSHAQTKPQPAAAADDASWMRTYAAAWQNIPAKPLTDNSQGHEPQLVNDLRFDKLLHSSFHQQQWFWYDHHRFTPLPDLARIFLGVPGSAVVDDDRYVTADGCVPHDCLDRGMLWIDTGTHPATSIFVATQMIRTVNGDPDMHLWLFASRHLDFENMPPDFRSSLERWHANDTAMGYPEEFTLVTLVQPSGEQVDLTYPTLNDQQNQPGAKK